MYSTWKRLYRIFQSQVIVPIKEYMCTKMYVHKNVCAMHEIWRLLNERQGRSNRSYWSSNHVQVWNRNRNRNVPENKSIKLYTWCLYNVHVQCMDTNAWNYWSQLETIVTIKVITHTVKCELHATNHQIDVIYF